MNIVDYQNCFIFILVCLLSLLCYHVMLRKPKESRVNDDLDLPPSPPSLPIIGHLHLLPSVLIHKSFQKLSDKYGPLLYLRILNVPIILVSSSSIAYEIFKTQDLNISFRGLPPIDESLFFGSSTFLMAPHGDYWKFMKKLTVTNLLGSQALERSRQVRAEELHRLYKTLLHKATKKESVEIGKEAIKLSTNTIRKMLMGRRSCCLEEESEAERARGLVTDSFALFKKLFLATLFRRFGLSLFKREILSVSRRFNELLERILGEHEEEKPKEHQEADMMDILLAAFPDENADYKITRNHIKSFVMEIFIAGSDSSGQTIQWTMAEIINNPISIKRLREEIDSVVGKTRLIQETDLPSLPYLQAVVKEGLRLHPPAPLFARTSREECRIRGFYIPENTTLVVNAYAVMRDSTSWEDPNEFNPERFLSSSSLEQVDEREQALNYIPFGAGRRGCPGANLSYTFVGTTIGMMVQCFEWRIINGDKVNMEEAAGAVNLTTAHPLKCTPVARNLMIPSS